MATMKSTKGIMMPSTSCSHCWLRFVSVRHLTGDSYLATFEVDGVATEHEVQVSEYFDIVGISGTSYFAMMDRGWKDLEEKRLMHAEVAKMSSAALALPRQQ